MTTVMFLTNFYVLPESKVGQKYAHRDPNWRSPIQGGNGASCDDRAGRV